MTIAKTTTHLISEASLPAPVLERITWIRAALVAQRHDDGSYESQAVGADIAGTLLGRSNPQVNQIVDHIGNSGLRYNRKLFKLGAEVKGLSPAQVLYYQAALLTMQVMFDRETNANAD